MPAPGKLHHQKKRLNTTLVGTDQIIARHPHMVGVTGDIEHDWLYVPTQERGNER